MSLLYRVVAFGQPRGPWRAKKRQAENDAIIAGIAEYDEWGQFYLDGFARIEWARIESLKKIAQARLALYS